MKGDRQGGVSLLELAVAILVLSIAILAGFRALDQGVRATNDQQQRVLAGVVARNHAEALQLPGPPPASVVSLGGQTWLVSATESRTIAGFSEVEVAVKSTNGGPGAKLVTFLSEGDVLR